MCNRHTVYVCVAQMLVDQVEILNQFFIDCDFDQKKKKMEKKKAE